MNPLDSDSSHRAAHRRVALITSTPDLVLPFLSTNLGSLGIEIPVAVLIRPQATWRDRLRHLPPVLKRQAKINRTLPLLQLAYRVLYYRIASEREHRTDRRTLSASALERLKFGREVVEARSVNEPAVVEALRGSECELGLVVGADVLTRRTLDEIRMPLVNLHMSDPAFVRGMPPIFWEVHDGQADLTLTLHRLTIQLDGGPVLVQSRVPIQWRESLAGTLAATRRIAVEEIAILLTESLPKILDGRLEARNVASGPVRTIPRLRDVMQARKVCRERASASRG